MLQLPSLIGPNCGCEPAVLQDVASITRPEDPLNAVLCMSAERSRDQPVCTVAACCHVCTTCKQYSAARPCGAFTVGTRAAKIGAHTRSVGRRAFFTFATCVGPARCLEHPYALWQPHGLALKHSLRPGFAQQRPALTVCSPVYAWLPKWFNFLNHLKPPLNHV